MGYRLNVLMVFSFMARENLIKLLAKRFLNLAAIIKEI